MIVKDLGLVDYRHTLHTMREFSFNREPQTADELWLLEHPATFTQGANGDSAHIINSHDIPVVQTDRGGQVTYHGPGQLIAYPLLDLKRLQLTVRQMVTILENTVISMLADQQIEAVARKDAPGVYVDDKKVASLGIRVKRGACYHGISINIDMDLMPFSYINPCGYAGMEMIDFHQLGLTMSMTEAKQQFVTAFNRQLQAG